MRTARPLNDLVGDEVLVVVGDVRGDLHAAVDGAGVHDPLPRPQPRLRDAVELAYSRSDGRKLAPALMRSCWMRSR